MHFVQHDEIEVAYQALGSLRVIKSVREGVQVGDENLRSTAVDTTNLIEELPLLRRDCGCSTPKFAAGVEFRWRERDAEPSRRPLHEVDQVLELVLSEHDSRVQEQDTDPALSSKSAISDMDQRSNLEGKGLTRADPCRH